MGLAAVKTLYFSSDADSHILEVVTLEYGQAALSITPQNPDGSLGKPAGHRLGSSKKHLRRPHQGRCRLSDFTLLPIG